MAFDNNDYRVTAPFAAYWRLTAELMRRHQAERPLYLWQFHPGASQRGALALARRRSFFARQELPELHIMVGGGMPGAVERVREGAVDPVGNLIDSLLKCDPKNTVDDMERLLCLPSAPNAQATTPTALVARLIAGFLERRIFDRRSFRTTFGYASTSVAGAVLADWVPGAKPRVALAAEDEAAFRACGAYVLLHECSADGEAAFSADALRSRALMFDLRGGDCVVVDKRGPAGERRVIDDYVSLGRKIDRLIHWIEDVFESPAGSTVPSLTPS